MTAPDPLADHTDPRLTGAQAGKLAEFEAAEVIEEAWEQPSVPYCPTCGATWGGIRAYTCDGPFTAPHPRVRTVDPRSTS